MPEAELEEWLTAAGLIGKSKTYVVRRKGKGKA